jgi:hypothetical protein
MFWNTKRVHTIASGVILNLKIHHLKNKKSHLNQNLFEFIHMIFGVKSVFVLTHLPEVRDK